MLDAQCSLLNNLLHSSLRNLFNHVLLAPLRASVAWSVHVTFSGQLDRSDRCVRCVRGHRNVIISWFQWFPITPRLNGWMCFYWHFKQFFSSAKIHSLSTGNGTFQSAILFAVRITYTWGLAHNCLFFIKSSKRMIEMLFWANNLIPNQLCA